MNKKKRKFFINFFTGLFTQFIILVLGLIVPRIVLTHYGSDTNGLLTTVTQIFTYMALLEAGISQAATNALFKPLKQNNQDNVNSILSSAQFQFRKISIFYAIGVIALSFVLPFVLKTSINYWTIFGVVLFEGLTNVVSFYFVNSWTCLLNADGKNYVVNIINFIGRLLCYLIKICLAIFAVNIAMIEIGYFLISLVKLLAFYLYFRKYYPDLKNIRNKDFQKFSDKKYYLISEISSVVFQSTDIILISIFLSTALSSVYSIYNLVFVSLSTLLNGAFYATTYVLNQAYIDDLEKYKKVHNIFNSVFMSIMCVFVCVSYFLIIPFVKLYTNGVTDIDYINSSFPLLFGIITLVSWSRYVPNNLMGISGHAKENAIISIIEASANIVVSLILINFLGISGVLIGTLVSLPIRVVGLNVISEKRILKRSAVKTLIIYFLNYFIFGLTVIVSLLIGTLETADVFEFILYGFLLVVIYTVVVFGLNIIINKDMFQFLSLIKKGRHKNE